MAGHPRRLYTLDYPLTAEQMGEVHIYPLTPDFARLWDRLAKRWRPKEGFTTPHGSLRTALSAVSGRMVNITVRSNEHNDAPLSQRSLLVSDGPLSPERTRTCFDVWQKLSYGGPPRAGEQLSQFIDFDRTRVLPLAQALEYDEAGNITGPWWWKDAVGWSVIKTLAPHPLIDAARKGSTTPFQVSTGRTLIAWDYPLSYTTHKGQKNERTEFGMAYVSAVGTTLRGHPCPIVRVDCHITRVARTYKNIKTVHVRHPRFPTILRVPVRSLPRRDANGDKITDAEGNLVWETRFRGHTAKIVEACGLEPLTLPEQADAAPDTVRAVFRSKGKHKIGKGVGAYFTLRMATHISDVLGTEPLIYDATSYNIPEKSLTRGPIPLTKLTQAVNHAGWHSLRIAVLYNSETTPLRILRKLAEQGLALPPDIAGTKSAFDGAEIDIAPGVTLVLCKSPELVMHGTHDRASIISKTPCLKPTGSDQLIVALCETSWNGTRAENDGKLPTRRALAQAGIVSQFLNAEGQDDEEDDEADHPATSALRNVLQNSGVTDNRISFATCATPGIRKKSPLTEPVTVVGLYFRRHNFKRVRGHALKPPKLVVRLVAAHLGTDPHAPTQFEMYDQGRWWRLAEGVAAFHTGSIGEESWGRYGEGAREVRQHVESALDSLILPPGTDRVVLVADKEGAQSIYPALGDNTLLTGPLPGRGLLEDGIDVAITRIALGAHAPRPATAYREGKDELRKMKPSYWKRILFSHWQGDETSWLFTQDSHQHQGAMSAQRLGTDRMREHFHEVVPSHMAKDMHATSRIEISVPQKGDWEPGDLAVLIARLCDQAVGWDHRTVRPVPLHLAHRADRDHPEYGDHDAGGEADEGEDELSESV